jgi:hypothetical protein
MNYKFNSIEFIHSRSYPDGSGAHFPPHHHHDKTTTSSRHLEREKERERGERVPKKYDP